MQKVFLITVLLGVTIALNENGFKLEEINNKKMFVKKSHACNPNRPGNCCFDGIVTLTIDHVGTKVNSFKFTGKQDGQNCDGTFTVVPTARSSTEETITENYYVAYYNKKVFPFFEDYHEITKEGKTIKTGNFLLYFPFNKFYAPVDLYFSSEQEYVKE